MPFSSRLLIYGCLVGFGLFPGTQRAVAQALPLAVYLQEGFNAAGIPAGWIVTTVSGGTAQWSVVGTGTNPPIAPYAGSGQAQFNSYDAAQGHQSRLTTRRLSLSTATDPFLSFFLYHDDEFISSADSVCLEVTTGDSVAGPWTVLTGYQRPSPTVGWKQELVSLLQYSGSANVFLGFRGVSQWGNNLYLDELRMADSSFHDLGMLSLFSPTGSIDSPTLPANKSRPRIRQGKQMQDTPKDQQVFSVIPSVIPLNVGAIVQNYGTFSEPTYQVQWQIDGQNQAAVGNTRTLSRSALDTLTLSWLTPTPGTHVIRAWTSLSPDSNRTNDSLRLTVVVLDSSVIFAEMFNGSVFPPSGWIAVNRDGGLLSPWFRGSSTSVFVPYEGTGFAGDNFQRANGIYLDDYLISPPIPGIGQAGRVDSLKFWVRSAFNAPPAQNYPDSLMVLLSTSGPDTSNFTIPLDYFSVPKTGWTLRGYQLTGRVPSNSTVRTAFRYLHYNGGSSGVNSDFVGVDFVHVTRNPLTAVEGSDFRPTTFALHQNYPNPFNPTTRIRYGLPTAADVTLKIYNVLGQEVATLMDGRQNAGTFEATWNGHNSSGALVASGIYFYSLVTKSADGRSAFGNIKKMLLLK